MSHPDPSAPDAPTPPQPHPGPAETATSPDVPTPAQLRAAAACLAALVYHNPPPRTLGTRAVGDCDTIGHLSAYTKVACTRTGLPNTAEVRLHVLRITVYALGSVAAVRPSELAYYLQAITPSQQLALFSLAHRRLAGQNSSSQGAVETILDGQEEA